MVAVVLSEKAERWFLQKVADLAAVNPQAARNLIARIERQKQLLATFPQMTERGLIPGTRKVSMPPFVLIIRKIGNTVEIASIRDGRQKDAHKPTNLLSADDDDIGDDNGNDDTYDGGSTFGP
jgi:plasmid stabilization system protein ParE